MSGSLCLGQLPGSCLRQTALGLGRILHRIALPWYDSHLCLLALPSVHPTPSKFAESYSALNAAPYWMDPTLQLIFAWSVEMRCICLHCLQPQPMQPAYYLLSAGLAVICPASDMISYSERYGGGLYHSMATRVRNDSQVPRPPRKDFYKLMNRDHIVLRYAIRLVTTTGYSLSETDRLAACNSCG